MQSSQIKFTNTIQIRDFILNVVPDRTKTQLENSNYVEIHTNVHLICEEKFKDHAIIMEDIPTCIRVYLPSEERRLFVPSAFFYAEGRFSTSSTTANKLEITVDSLSLERYHCFSISQSQHLQVD